MTQVTARSLRVNSIVKPGDNITTILLESIKNEEFLVCDGDVIAIASKIVASAEGSVVDLSTIDPSEEAYSLSKETQLDSRVVEVILGESFRVINTVYKGIICETRYGVCSNAGVDTTNVPPGFAIKLPNDANSTARTIHLELKQAGLDVPVVVTDTRTIPLRWGTTGLAIGSAGINSVVDYRGKEDLYGNHMVVSMRAVVDNIASLANIVMGETTQMTPFAVISGVEFERDEGDSTKPMNLSECMYFSAFVDKLNE